MTSHPTPDLPDGALSELLAKATSHPDLATREVATFDLEQFVLPLATDFLRMRKALRLIESGSTPGIIGKVLSGDWHSVVNDFQARARAAMLPAALPISDRSE